VTLYWDINILRIAEGRMNKDYLRRSVGSSILWLGFAQVSAMIAWWLGDKGYLDVSKEQFFKVIAGASLLVAVASLYTVFRNMYRTRPKGIDEHFSDKELPTVSLVVPARNETPSLTSMLELALASDYPKLEILVFDDNSQDRTAEIIRSFAHDGVRFIEGTLPPNEHWLHKNWAYETLYEQAAGEYVLFAGVDVRLEPQSIRLLVTQSLNRKLDMLCIMPSRSTVSPMSLFIQPMRYWWQLVVPKNITQNPSVLSTCWLIKRKTLKKMGGFASNSRKVVPETFFARELGKKHLYNFVRSNKELGIYTEKDARDQLYTAVRTRYLLVHRHPERVLLSSLFEVGALVTPFLLTALGFVYDIGIAHLFSVLAVICILSSYVVLTIMTDRKAWWIALINFPIVVMIDVVLLNWSMWLYEFGEVEWKGRNISLPVMHAIPSLPKLD
jgi:glycosyltransferase involved in cell wall biosynthesis